MCKIVHKDENSVEQFTNSKEIIRAHAALENEILNFLSKIQ